MNPLAHKNVHHVQNRDLFLSVLTGKGHKGASGMLGI